MWSEIPHNKLPDEIAACNMIKQNRHVSARRIRKTITLHIGEDIDGRIISTVLKLFFATSTEHVSLGHCLTYRNRNISPSTNKRLVCTNAHALKQLEKTRAYHREYQRERRAEARAQA
ncbi:MAG: hypothetical protein KAJ03_00260 [Gammaproteobacteria bacterium]|nr:hypothetical protein [Gammaproteobacteria bacterium]